MSKRKPVSDRWIEAVNEYGYNPFSNTAHDSHVTIRKLARELQRVREAVRDHRESQCENDEDYSVPSDRVLYRSVLPEGDGEAANQTGKRS